MRIAECGVVEATGDEAAQVVDSAGLPSGNRWIGGVAVGMGLAVPLGCLLSYPAFLPAMLGLFFFLLFGLIIGAAMFRVWSPARPMARGSVRLGAVLVTLCCWGSSMLWEAATFPDQAAKEAIRQVPKAVPGKTADDIRAEAKTSAKSFLSERYPPGGMLGYWRWGVKGGKVEIPIVGVAKPKPIRLGNTGTLFVVRLALSAVAMFLGIRAIVWPLTRPPADGGVTAAPEPH